jgi:predicted PolB exonuclease-like 3'-5' exonuclease
MQNTFTYDIETVPRKGLSNEVMEEVDKKTKASLQNKDYDVPEYNKQKQMIMGTSPYYGMIICIGIRLDQNGKYDKLCLSADNYSMDEERDMLNEFWRLAAKDRWLFIGYNSKSFDAFWIIRRSMFHKIIPTNRDFLDMYKFDTIHHFDCMNFLCDFEWQKKVSLKTACEFLGIPSPKEGEVKGENVADYYEQGKLKDIADYCLRDIDATHSLYQRCRTYAYKKPKY